MIGGRTILIAHLGYGTTTPGELRAVARISY
jgi:hypothetical protein